MTNKGWGCVFAIGVFLELAFLIWVLWASVSTGGLYELKQINPKYAHPNKSVAYLVSKLDHSKSSWWLDPWHVEECSLYMPNWAKTENCVRERIHCEHMAPRVKNWTGILATPGDTFSDEFRSCWSDNHPFFGPAEWLRASRVMFRIGVTSGVMWVTGSDNKGWRRAFEEWLEKGQ